MIEFYWMANCSTCKKAKQFLNTSGVKIDTVRDLKAAPLNPDEVKRLTILLAGAENLFSRKAIKYREMKLNERVISTDEMIEFMSKEYTFIRRPVLIANNGATCGFSEEKFREVLGK